MIYSTKEIEDFKQLLIDKKEIIRKFDIDQDILKGYIISVEGTINKRFEFSNLELAVKFANMLIENLTIGR